MNSICITGRLCADPELKVTPSGVNVVSVDLAVNRNRNSKEADFITVVGWRGTAEFICNYFTKGQMMAVHGELQSRSYTAADGIKRKVWEVVADYVGFCGDKKSQTAEVAEIADADGFSEVADSGDLPF